mgnify:CR=1 FL=1
MNDRPWRQLLLINVLLYPLCSMGGTNALFTCNEGFGGDCYGATINCSDYDQCTVDCNSNWGCRNSTIYCASDCTMIIVTHEMGFAKEVASKVIFLDQGCVEEEETPDKFFNNPQSERLKRFLATNL